MTVALGTVFGAEEIPSWNPDKPPLLILGGGIFDVTRKHPRSMYQIEYRAGKEIFKNLRPDFGLFWSRKGAVYLWAGLSYDIYFGRKIVMTPSFAPGLFWKGGGKGLHFPLEFRSSIELAYVFDNKARFGAQFYHLSHAGLGGKNPGTEDLVFYLALPLRKLF